MEAAREGHVDVVKLLLERGGSEVNAQTEETGETALTLASCGGFRYDCVDDISHVKLFDFFNFRDVVELLLGHGADLFLGANTPLMEAAQEGHVDTVKYLVEVTLKHPAASVFDLTFIPPILLLENWLNLVD